MLRLLAFLGVTFGLVAASVGGALGYARHDPQYTCLNFNNVTVQLDTSLFVRSRIPLWNINSNPAPDGEHRIVLEMTSPHLRQPFPNNPSEWYYPGSYSAVIQSSRTGERITLESDVSGRAFSEIRWLENNHLTYRWLSASENQWYLSVFDTEASRHLLKIPLDTSALNLGWTGDGRYYPVTHPITNPSVIEVVDAVEGKSQVYEMGVDVGLLGYSTFWKHRVSFLAQGNLYVIDLDTGRQQRFPSPEIPGILPLQHSWSPDGEYVYLMQSSPDEVFYKVMHLGEGLSTVTSDHVKQPTWAHFVGWNESTPSFFYELRNDGKLTLRHLNLETGEDKVIAPNVYQVDPQSEGNVWFSALGDDAGLYLYNPVTQQSRQLIETDNNLNLSWVTPSILQVSEAPPYSQDTSLAGYLHFFNQDGQALSTFQFSKTSLSQVNPSQGTLMVVEIDIPNQIVKSTLYALETGEATPLPDMAVENLSTYNQLTPIPDSQDWLLALSEEPPSPKTTFYRLDTATGRVVPLAELPAGYHMYNKYFVWSPDGKYLTVTYPSSQPGFELVVIALDGGGLQNLGRFGPYPSLFEWTKCTY
jgi:hypothetical protein